MHTAKRQNRLLAIQIVMVFSLLAALQCGLGYSVHAEAKGQPDISFSVPFTCSNGGREGRCLADSFKSGLDVILVGENTRCSAKTGEPFTDAEDFEATRLTGTDKCLAVTEKDQESFGTFRIGVLASGPVKVRLVTPQVDGFSTPNDMESKARQLARFPIEKPQENSALSKMRVSLSPEKPRVLRTENITLLIFDLHLDGSNWEAGPTVALINHGAFLLKGTCTGEHIFFFVNDKLFLTYGATVHCCGCGDTNFFVYDLSNGTPKMVYQNSSLSH